MYLPLLTKKLSKPIILLIFILVSTYAAATEELPCSLEVSIIAKMLSYDRNLKIRADSGNTIQWAIVYHPDIPASKQRAEEMGDIIQKMGMHRMVPDHRIIPHTVPFNDMPDLQKTVAEKNIGIAYLCAGLGLHIEDITRLSRAKKILTIGGTTTYVQNGVSMGVFKQQNKPRMVVNLEASRSEGAHFSTSLLKLATVLR